MLCPPPPRICDHNELENRWSAVWLRVSRSTPDNMLPQPSLNAATAVRRDILLRQRIMRDVTVFPQTDSAEAPPIPFNKTALHSGLSLLTPLSIPPEHPDHAHLERFRAYGGDVLRFASAMQSTWPPGVDRLQGSLSLFHKLWNCMRFTCVHLRGDEPLCPDTVGASDMDRWFLQRLNTTTARVNDLFERNRLSGVCARLQHLIRRDLSGWYLEFSRHHLDERSTRQCIRYSLLHTAHLLHPFMPNITQEIFARVGPRPAKLLIHLPYPEFRSELVFRNAARRIDIMRGLTEDIRRIIGRNSSPSVKGFDAILTGDGNEAEKRWLSDHAEDLRRLAGIGDLHFQSDPPPRAFRGGHGHWSVHIPITDARSHATILRGMRREREELNRRIHRMQRKLADREYLESLPPGTTQRWKRRLQQETRRRERLIRTLGWISTPEERREKKK